MSCCLALFVEFGIQSLADVAREEAERRKRLEDQGVEAKVIEEIPAESAKHGNLSTSTVPASKGSKKPPGASAPANGKPLRSYRTSLQKLDQAIRQHESRLEARRKQLQSERRKPNDGKESKVQEKLREEIESLETKLSQLRRERSETYDEGKKAGFLPGELDGKGIIP